MKKAPAFAALAAVVLLAAGLLTSGGPPRGLGSAEPLYASAGGSRAYRDLYDHLTPVFGMLYKPLSDLPGEQPARTLFGINLAALVLGLVLTTFVFVKEPRRRAAVLVFGGATLYFSYPVVAMQMGSLCGVAALFFAAAVALVELGRFEFAAGLALAAASALYPYYVLALLPVLCLRRVLVVCGCAVGAAFFFALAPDLWSEFFAKNAELWWSGCRAYENLSLTALLAGLFGRTAEVASGRAAWFITFAQWSGVALIASAAACMLARGARIGETGRKSRGFAFAWTLPVMLCLPVSVHPSTAAALLPMLPAFAARWERAGGLPERAALAATALGLALSQLAPSAVPAWLPALGVPVLAMGLLLSECFALRTLASTASAPLEEHSDESAWTERLRPWLLGLAGALVFTAALVCYGLFERSHLPTLTLWLLSMLLMYAALGGRTLDARLPRIRRTDALIALGLCVFAIPFYVVANYEIPVQVNSDELIALNFYRELLARPNPDVLGVAKYYFCVPNGSFISVAAIAQLADGLSFGAARWAGGLYSVAAVGIFYLVLRSWRSRIFALCAALLFASSHALVGVSRQTLVDNIPIFVGVLALGVLMYGLKKRSAPILFLGGVIAGVGVYCYYPARAYLPVWFVFLAVYAFLNRAQFGFRDFLHSALLSGLGMTMCAAPMALAVYKERDRAFGYSRQQSVLYPEGRALVRAWEGTSDTTQAVLNNALYGLTAFNSNQADRSNMYSNPGHGFVDPLTGVLLWLGLWRLVRKKNRTRADLLALAGFFVIWVPLSLLTTKNPAYCRLLVILPFVCYLAAEGARFVLFRLKWPRVTLATVALVIVSWNAKIYGDHWQRGEREGCGAGSSVRYVAAHANEVGKAYYVLMDEQYPYYWFGGVSWKLWFSNFIGPTQTVELVPSKPFLFGFGMFRPAHRPCAIMMPEALWKQCATRLRAAYPDLQAVPVTPTGQYWAIEIPGDAPKFP
ncbi:MAG: glycosyltransferase family 39 protein [Planctomycetes bacterium]|nr:glycosyltransferase family 39 protein [Planctomycetota bacterium]